MFAARIVASRQKAEHLGLVRTPDRGALTGGDRFDSRPPILRRSALHRSTGFSPTLTAGSLAPETVVLLDGRREPSRTAHTKNCESSQELFWQFPLSWRCPEPSLPYPWLEPSWLLRLRGPESQLAVHRRSCVS